MTAYSTNGPLAIIVHRLKEKPCIPLKQGCTLNLSKILAISERYPFEQITKMNEAHGVLFPSSIFIHLADDPSIQHNETFFLTRLPIILATLS